MKIVPRDKWKRQQNRRALGTHAGPEADLAEFVSASLTESLVRKEPLLLGGGQP